MKLDEIMVTDRHRVDLGDVSALAESIKANGLLHPVVVTTEGRMIAGHRRLEACRSLGWTDIKVTVIDGLLDASRLLFMERDENVCRKDMTPSEKIGLGRALEELERPKAKAAQLSGLKVGHDSRSVPPNETGRRQAYDVREDVAPAVGLSTASYSRAKQLLVAAESGDDEAQVRVEEMDRTGKITKPYEDWKGHKVNRGTEAPTARSTSDEPTCEPSYREGQDAKWLRVADLAGHGYTSPQIAREVGMSEGGLKAGAKREGIDIRADRIVGNVRRLDMRRVIEQTVIELESIASTTNNLISVAGIRAADIDRDEIQTWVDSLTSSITALSKVRKTIKESIS